MGAGRMVAAAALGACLALPAGAAGDDCDPAVERALVENAEIGAKDDVKIVRHPEMGIRDPESLFDLSCVTDMFDYSHADILYRPDRGMTDMLGLLEKFICDRAREAYRGFVGRGLNPAAFARELPRLPGLDVEAGWGDLLDDARAKPGGAASDRTGPSGPNRPVEGGAYQGLPPKASDTGAAGRSRPDLFRSLIGGDEKREDGG